jgi:GT2 family glycosyltransferase
VCDAAPAGLPVRLLRRPRGGPAAARNTGADAARGTVLAFTDDDCRPDPGWLTAMLAAVRPGVAVGGLTFNGLRRNPYAEASQHIHDLVYAHYNRDPSAARFLASNNLAMRREEFLAVGGFDTDFPFASEDRDFSDRWRASGRKLRFDRAALVDHRHDLSLRSFLRQHVAYGRGAARFHSARAERGTGRLRDDMAFHRDLRLWRDTLGLRPARRAAQTAALLWLWQVANAAGYVLERRRGPVA